MARRRKKQLGRADTTTYVLGGLMLAGLGLVGVTIWLVKKGR